MSDMTPEERAYWGIAGKRDDGGPVAPAPFPGMLATNNPNAEPAAPLPVPPPGLPPPPPPVQDVAYWGSAPSSPQPFPGMLARPLPSPAPTGLLTSAEELAILQQGATPQQAADLGVIPHARLNSPAPPSAAASPFAATSGATVSAPIVSRAETPKPIAKGPPGSGDAFGVGAANKALLGTYGQQRAGIEHQANAEGARALQRAEGMEQLSRTMTEDAAIEHAQGAMADQTFADHMTEVQRQIDDLREKKIDPTRKLADKGIGILAVIGGVVGGLYQGINHLQSNPFLDDLHRIMNDDMRAQQSELDNGRAAVGDQMNLLGQMRAVYKDKQLADLQTRNLVYEATKQGIEAEAGRSDDAIIKARAEQALAAVNREQALLQKQIAEQARAQAAAAAAQQMAQVKEARARLDTMYTATYDKALAAFKGRPDAAERAEYEAQRTVATLMGGGAGPRPASQQNASAPTDLLANVPEKQQEHAAKELETFAKAQKSGNEIDKLFAEYKALPPTAGPWDKDRAAIEARILAAYKQGLGPDAHLSSDNDAKAFLEPLKPEATETDATTAHKAAMIKRSIEGSYATPLLDTHNPGWRAPPPKGSGAERFDVNGKPIK